MQVHPSRFERRGNSLRFIDNHSISIQKNYCGFHDFATGENGNSLDFLVRHLQYLLPDAVDALLHYGDPMTTNPFHPTVPEVHFQAPPVYTGSPSRIVRYLSSRGIPEAFSRQLIKCGLIYQSEQHGTVVFLSKKKDYYELRGTSPGVKFHQCGKLNPDRFWAFRPSECKLVYGMVCESAIDAISLYLLISQKCPQAAHDYVYCSIGGVSNQKAIDRIRSFLPVIIAVDNDPAGEDCRKRNATDLFLCPMLKDWNEDLCSLRCEQKKGCQFYEYNDYSDSHPLCFCTDFES